MIPGKDARDTRWSSSRWAWELAIRLKNFSISVQTKKKKNGKVIQHLCALKMWIQLIFILTWVFFTCWQFPSVLRSARRTPARIQRAALVFHASTLSIAYDVHKPVLFLEWFHLLNQKKVVKIWYDSDEFVRKLKNNKNQPKRQQDRTYSTVIEVEWLGWEGTCNWLDDTDRSFLFLSGVLSVTEICGAEPPWVVIPDSCQNMSHVE